NVAQFERVGFAAQHDLDVNWFARRADVGVRLFDFTHFVPRESVIGVGAIEILMHEQVHRVAGKRNADLIVAGWKIYLHQAQITGAATDVDEQRIYDRVDVSRLTEASVVAITESGEKWFRD